MLNIKPKMILFDYGQTLITEEYFNALKGNQALLDVAVKNPNHVSAIQIQELANALTKDISESFHSTNRNYQKMEMTSYAFNKYLYEYLEIEFDLTQEEIEWIFWSNAAPGKPTKDIEKLLDYLYDNGIRTGVISNMMNSTKSLTCRLNELLPGNHFEFIIASSDYMFRKPHHRLFDLALVKAKLDAKDVWYCGDNLYCDMEGAYQIGMKAIWYPTYIDSDYNVSTEAEYIHNDTAVSQLMRIDDWDELIAMLKSKIL